MEKMGEDRKAAAPVIPTFVQPECRHRAPEGTNWCRMFALMLVTYVLVACTAFTTINWMAHRQEAAAVLDRDQSRLMALDRHASRMYSEGRPMNVQYKFTVEENGLEGEANVDIDTKKNVEKVMVPQIGDTHATDNLHDFNTNFTALKVADANACYIQPLVIPAQLAAAMDKEQMREAVVHATPRQKHVVPGPIDARVLAFTAGPEIASFCSGLAAHWLVNEAPRGGISSRHHPRARRQASAGNCQQVKVNLCLTFLNFCTLLENVQNCHPDEVGEKPQDIKDDGTPSQLDLADDLFLPPANATTGEEDRATAPGGNSTGGGGLGQVGPIDLNQVLGQLPNLIPGIGNLFG